MYKILNCLKNVYLEIIPPAVQKGHNVTLLCHYDMEGAPLYSVKWYRGKHEFYRYTPSDSPQSKVFPLHGISVDKCSIHSTKSDCLFRNLRIKPAPDLLPNEKAPWQNPIEYPPLTDRSDYLTDRGLTDRGLSDRLDVCGG
ncbi:hypothetical protein M8J77_010427 [Diaphorina citri]|nr:hypothetical protein M8J77_010427 [Diaphorina citri]